MAEKAAAADKAAVEKAAGSPWAWRTFDDEERLLFQDCFAQKISGKVMAELCELTEPQRMQHLRRNAWQYQRGQHFTFE